MQLYHGNASKLTVADPAIVIVRRTETSRAAKTLDTSS
jgi:hypothetical protein